MVKGKWWWIILGAGIVLLLALVQLRLPAVQAQCGTQASSCKSCHEVQAKDPVNSKGVWHTDHAFGDFCEFCHAGNVHATDKAAAHQGLVAWNADVKASCASCHATDYETRGQTYASTLGVQLNTGGGAAGTSAVAVSGATAACAPQGGEEIDYNLLYAQHIARPPLVSNWGNLILGVMILGLGAVFFGTAWTWEGWGRKVAAWIRNNVMPVTQAVADVSKRSEDAGSSAFDPEQHA
ncbi:MAG: hypothetical protein NT169_21765 [Chloroflexi bacterium]|nr:hypothetical protein [Chloroflexota bacterium]